MEKAKEARDKALKHLKIADHMLTQTYKTLNDQKILLTVLENLFLALTNSMAAILHYERYHHRIPPFQDTFDSKFNMLKLKVANLYPISQEALQFMLDIKYLIVAYKESPAAFSRKQAYIICSEEYDVKSLSEEGMKKSMQKAKAFVGLMQDILDKKFADLPCQKI